VGRTGGIVCVCVCVCVSKICETAKYSAVFLSTVSVFFSQVFFIILSSVFAQKALQNYIIILNTAKFLKKFIFHFCVRHCELRA
jgi:hypothetical protein